MEEVVLMAIDSTGAERRVLVDTNGSLIVSPVTISSLPSLPAGSNVIGKVDIQDGSGNPLSSTSGALDVEIQNFPATQAISGTVAVSNFPSAYAVTQSTSPWIVDASGSTVPVSGPLTDAQLRASAISVDASGTTVPVNVQNSSVAVTGTFWQATQPVSGTVSVSGTVAVSQSGSWSISVSNFPATQLVSGTVAAIQSGTWNIGTLTSITDSVAVTGTFWQATQPISGTVEIGTSSGAFSYALNQDSSGNVGVNVENSVAVTGTFYQTTQPVSIATMPTTPVTGTFWQTTQPVSGTITANAGTGTFSVDASGYTVPVSGTFWQTTQPVSVASLPALGSGSTFQQVPATSGGMGLPYSASLTSTKAQVKGAAGQIYGWIIVNNGSALCYIQVFNKLSTNVTVGTTAPDFVIPIPAPASGTGGAGVAQSIDLGIAMTTGITVACTTTRTGATSATCDVLFYYN